MRVVKAITLNTAGVSSVRSVLKQAAVGADGFLENMSEATAVLYSDATVIPKRSATVIV